MGREPDSSLSAAQGPTSGYQRHREGGHSKLESPGLVCRRRKRGWSQRWRVKEDSCWLCSEKKCQKAPSKAALTSSSHPAQVMLTPGPCGNPQKCLTPVGVWACATAAHLTGHTSKHPGGHLLSAVFLPRAELVTTKSVTLHPALTEESASNYRAATNKC